MGNWGLIQFSWGLSEETCGIGFRNTHLTGKKDRYLSRNTQSSISCWSKVAPYACVRMGEWVLQAAPPSTGAPDQEVREVVEPT